VEGPEKLAFAVTEKKDFKELVSLRVKI